MTTVITREQGYPGLAVEIIRITTTSSLAQVTTAGWYNNSVIAGENISPVDQLLICYSFGTANQATSLFDISIVNGIVTLSLSQSSVVLPTIANHIATYTNTSGTLSEDPATAISAGNIQAGLITGVAGSFISYAATPNKGQFIFAATANTGNTSTTLLNRAMGQASAIFIPDPANAVGQLLIGATATPFVSGNFPKASGTGGLMVDSGLAVTNIVAKNAANTMAAGSSIVLAKVNGTEAANAVTASGVAGLLTTSALTTAAGSSYAITWTNTFITATSVVLLTLAGGTNTTENITLKCAPGSGTATLTIYNNDPAAALNGTILMSYAVL